MKTFAPILIFVVAVWARSVVAVEWALCEDGPFRPSRVALHPDPPVSGKDVMFSIKGIYAPEDAAEISSGSLNVDVEFMGTPIFNTQWDLCGKTSCPITPGELDIEYSQTLPPIAPPGAYVVKLEAESDSGEKVFCMTVDFNIKPPSIAALASTLRTH